MEAVITTPTVVDVQRGQHIIVTVDGVPALFIKSDGIRHMVRFDENAYDHYEFVAMGLSVRTNPNSYKSQYNSSCAATMNLEVTELTTDAITYAATQRYGKN